MLDNEFLEELFTKYIGYKLDYKECDVCKLYLPDKSFINFECSHKACFNCCLQFNSTKCHLCREFLSDLKGLLCSNNRIINYNNKLAEKRMNENKYLEAIKFLNIGLEHGCNKNFYTIGICYMNLKEVKRSVEYFFKFLLTIPLIVKSSEVHKNLNNCIFVAYVTICSYIFDYKKEDNDLIFLLNKSKFYLGLNYILQIENDIIIGNKFNILNDELVNNNLFRYLYLIGLNKIDNKVENKIINYFYIYLLDNINCESILIEVLEFLIDNYDYFYKIDMTLSIKFLIDNDSIYKNDLIEIKKTKKKISLNDFYILLNKRNVFKNKFENDSLYSKYFNEKLLLEYHYIQFVSNTNYKNYSEYLDLFLLEITKKISEENDSIYPRYLDYILEIINKELKTNKNVTKLKYYKNKVLEKVIKNCLKETDDGENKLILINNKIENKKRKINHI